MTKKEKKEIQNLVEIEGFDYALVDGDDFKFVKDKKFHELRQAFLAARSALVEYLGVEA